MTGTVVEVVMWAAAATTTTAAAAAGMGVEVVSVAWC
jgi:hypothetical protein